MRDGACVGVPSSLFKNVSGDEDLASSQKEAVEGSEKESGGTIVTPVEWHVALTYSGKYLIVDFFADQNC